MAHIASRLDNAYQSRYGGGREPTSRRRTAPRPVRGSGYGQQRGSSGTGERKESPRDAAARWQAELDQLNGPDSPSGSSTSTAVGRRHARDHEPAAHSGAAGASFQSYPRGWAGSDRESHGSGRRGGHDPGLRGWQSDDDEGPVLEPASDTSTASSAVPLSMALPRTPRLRAGVSPAIVRSNAKRSSPAARNPAGAGAVVGGVVRTPPRHTAAPAPRSSDRHRATGVRSSARPAKHSGSPRPSPDRGSRDGTYSGSMCVMWGCCCTDLLCWDTVTDVCAGVPRALPQVWESCGCVRHSDVTTG